MPSRFTFASERASSRRESEDRAEVFEVDAAVVAVVADGAGGIRGGAVASEALISAARSHVQGDTFEPWDVHAWSNLFARVDADLAKRFAGETTAVVVVIGARGMLGVSAGDSEAWMVGATRIDDLTVQQTRKRLGSGAATFVSFQRNTLEGLLVMATDGLFKHTSAERIASACREASPAEVARALIGLPRLRSGVYPDDVVVVVISSSDTMEETTRKKNYLHRGLGLVAGGSPLVLLLASTLYGLRHGNRLSVAGLVVELLALSVAGSNFYLSFIRGLLHLWRQRRTGSNERYRHISGAPLIGTLLVVAGALLGFGSIVPAVVGLAAVVFDTGGTVWFLIATWRDSSLWDTPSRELPYRAPR